MNSLHKKSKGIVTQKSVIQTQNEDEMFCDFHNLYSGEL